MSSVPLSGQEQVDPDLEELWNSNAQQIASIHPPSENWKIQTLPLARVKKIMKSEEFILHELEKERREKAAATAVESGETPPPEDTKPPTKFMISGEAPVLMSKACELMVKELSFRAWRHTERNRRRTLQKQDLHAAVGESEMYDFLIDIVPRVVSQKAQPHQAHQQRQHHHSHSAEATAAATAAVAAATAAATAGIPGGSQQYVLQQMQHAHKAHQLHQQDFLQQQQQQMQQHTMHPPGLSQALHAPPPQGDATYSSIVVQGSAATARHPQQHAHYQHQQPPTHAITNAHTEHLPQQPQSQPGPAPPPHDAQHFYNLGPSPATTMMATVTYTPTATLPPTQQWSPAQPLHGGGGQLGSGNGQQVSPPE